MEYNQLSVSDGTGEAVVANIEANRAIAAVTIDVDSVENFPNDFIFATGDVTDDGFIDPASMTVMYGHLDSGNVIVDGFAPGYVDDGNTSGQILVIKPNTYWADEIVRLAQVAHSDDGKIKPNAEIDGGTNLGQGWLSTEEEWEYASFDAATDTGTITVPTDATTKYSAGMKIRFTQVTGGTKYGIITKVTATVLTVHFGTDYTLNNEDITAPCFSLVKTPLGFPLSPEKWTLTTTSTSNRTIAGTWATLTDNLVVPIGAWKLLLKATLQRSSAASTSNGVSMASLSSSVGSETNSKLTMYINGRFGSAGASSSLAYTAETSDDVTLAAQTTFTLVGNKVAGDDCTVAGASNPTVIRAVNAYL